MQARLILGPAGSGKTFRCLAEIRAALAAAPDGPPLLLLAPKQTTFQLERQLLADPALPGYARLQILSFERLARFILHELQPAPPQMLNEEGRLMVLRGLLAKKRNELRLFRASARLNGFAQHLSLALRELQRQQLTPESLAELAEHAQAVAGLGDKLHDLATLLRDYLDWLAARGLQDAEHLLDFATETLRAPHPPLALGGVWVDGFTEMSPQELGLLAELLPLAPRAAVTFCLDQVPTEKISWLSHWSVVRQTFHQCRERLAALPNCHVTTELLPRRATHGRFNPVLQHLEAHWANPKPFPAQTGRQTDSDTNLEDARFSAPPLLGERAGVRASVPSTNLKSSLRLAICAKPRSRSHPRRARNPPLRPRRRALPGNHRACAQPGRLSRGAGEHFCALRHSGLH